jgi:hypothetical protein
MKVSLKASPKHQEHIRLKHDACLGFMVCIGPGYIHVRAKSADEPDCLTTTIVRNSSKQEKSLGERK